MALSLNNAIHWLQHRAEDTSDTLHLHSRMFDLKQEALKSAWQDAQKAGKAQFTLEDYYQKFEQLAMKSDLFSAQEKNDPKHDRFMRVSADLNGQKLEHIKITDPRQLAVDPNDVAAQANIHRMMSFYDSVDFRDAIITGKSVVDPAQSYPDQIKNARVIEHTEFRNVGPKDTINFGSGEVRDIKITNRPDADPAKMGGMFVFDGTHASNIDMAGVHVTNLVMKNHAHIDDLHAQGANFVHINGEKGSVLSNADFNGATVTGDSEMKGMHLRQVDFSNTNMHDVDFSGAHMDGVNFPKDLKGVNLSGATLTHCLVDGKPIASPAQLMEFGATVDHTHVRGQVAAQAKDKPPEQDKFAALLNGVNLPAAKKLDVDPAKFGEFDGNTVAGAANDRASAKSSNNQKSGMTQEQLAKYYSANQGREGSGTTGASRPPAPSSAAVSSKA